jgi:hypothetical protein
VIKKNPVWGVGFDANLRYYFDDYDLMLPDLITRESYWTDYHGREFSKGVLQAGKKIKNWETRYKGHNSLENIALTFLVQMGILFSIVYFGGVPYIFTVFFKRFNVPPQKTLSGLFLIAILIGFAFISCTFDTLRFPNLNWVFHSLLGLMVNLPQNSIGKQPEPG